MANLNLSFACWNYDRTRGLLDGTVRPEGIDLTYLTMGPAETFQRMVGYKEFDVSELGFKFYVGTLELDDPPFIAIPVFPLRLFRHSAIFVNRNAGIDTPKDLIGKRVGEPFAYGHDAAIWARGILSDEYGVPADAATYYVGALDAGFRRDFAPFPLPEHIRVEKLGAGQTLDAMLASGELDALYTAIAPPSFARENAPVKRLFEDFVPVERAYFEKTRIFPIMHVVAIRRELYREHPWIAQSLYKAFKAAKAKAADGYAVGQRWNQVQLMIPWLGNLIEENRRLMGDDMWPYGLASDVNVNTVDAFLRYFQEQGLSKKRFTPQEIFAPEALVDYSVFPT